MITVNNYISPNVGNHMFTYAFARLVAEANNINLDADLLKIPCTPVKTFSEPVNKKGTKTICDYTYKNSSPNIPQLDPNYDYVISGYFQDADLYNKHVSQIRGFFNIDYPDNLLDKTLVTVRLGDFLHEGYNSEIIHYDYYKHVLSSIKGEVDISVGGAAIRPGVQVATEEQEAKYLSYFVKDYFNVITPEENFLKEFTSNFKYKTMILSNSTWAWWAGFLSKCSDIYTFEKTGWFTPGNHKCHGVHINNLYNIRNISKPIDGDFIDITKL